MENKKNLKTWKKPTLSLQTTTLWDYPSQHYGETEQGAQSYIGATPSYIIWNVLQRYTKKSDLVLDPMCGSGTTLDVCKDLERTCAAYDLVPSRPEILQSDARNLPLKNATVDFVFIDPPYSTHVDYSDHIRCIGKLNAHEGSYYVEMQKVIKECARVLKPEKYLALYVSDSYVKGKGLEPIGFKLLQQMTEFFTPVDIICVTRHNAKLKKGNFHQAAETGNFFLRGFNYLFLMQKN